MPYICFRRIKKLNAFKKIGNYIESTEYSAYIKAIGLDPEKARPTTNQIYKMGITMMPSGIKKKAIQQTVSGTESDSKQVLAGEELITFIPGLRYVVLAAILTCNAYFQKDLIKLFIMQVETLNIVMKFVAFRGDKPRDVYKLTREFVAQMLTGSSATDSYNKALNTVNKANEIIIKEKPRGNNNNSKPKIKTRPRGRTNNNNNNNNNYSYNPTQQKSKTRKIDNYQEENVRMGYSSHICQPGGCPVLGCPNFKGNRH